MDDAIAWSKDRQLSWADYRAEFNPSAIQDAHTAVRFRPEWMVDSDAARGRIIFTVRDVRMIPEFLPSLSWVRPTESSDELLLHEQGRFDLAKILADGADSLRSFDGKEFPTRGKNEEQRKQSAREDSARMLAEVAEKTSGKFHEMAADYDRQTDFGKNLKAQAECSEKFARLRQ